MPTAAKKYNTTGLPNNTEIIYFEIIRENSRHEPIRKIPLLLVLSVIMYTSEISSAKRDDKRCPAAFKLK